MHIILHISLAYATRSLLITKMWQLFYPGGLSSNNQNSHFYTDKENFSIVNGKAFTEDNVMVYNVFVYNIPKKVSAALEESYVYVNLVIFIFIQKDHKRTDLRLFQKIWRN